MTFPISAPAFLLRNVRLSSDPSAPIDLRIEEGRIMAIGPDLATDDLSVMDGGGAMLIPGFVESHIHLDKACILDRCRNETGTLAGAIASVAVAKAAFSEEDIYFRGAGVLQKAIAQGTNALRTHVEIDPVVGLKGFRAVTRLKQDFAWALDLQICVFPQDGLTNLPGTLELLDEALDQGADLLGGCPYTDPEPDTQIRLLFELARARDVDLDFHLDFHLDPRRGHLDEILRQTEAHEFQGRVTIGHVTSLSALPAPELDAVLKRLVSAGVALTVLPATDLYLMGRGHDHLVPRGVTPAHRLAALGGCCTLATNNVLNPFTPYGDCSLPRLANLYANIQQLGEAPDLETCLAMVTSLPERLLGRERRIVAGAEATFIALDARDGAQVVGEIRRPVWGMKKGRMTFEAPAPRVLGPRAAPFACEPVRGSGDPLEDVPTFRSALGSAPGPAAADLEAAFASYEAALVSNDVATLDRLFLDAPQTIRYGGGENLYGYAQIAAYRAGRSPAGLDRVLSRTVLTAHGPDVAVASTLFHRDTAPGKVGRQMQTWVRTSEGWKIAAAHVSVIDDPEAKGSPSL